MRRLFILTLIAPAILAVSLLTAGLAHAASGGIAGAYSAFGMNTDGSTYEGTAQIADNGDGSYTLNWQVGSSYTGRGTLEGRILTVDFGDSSPVVYVLMEDGELHGTWADGYALDRLAPAQ